VRVVTWNLLHRVHAMNWSEPAIATHASEPARIAAITTWIPELEGDVVCLQEVSGDQLAALRDHGELFVHTHPRLPHDRFGTSQLVDLSEHLVTICRRPARRVTSETYPTDNGKGFLVVECDGVFVINTHVSFGEHHAAQCARLAEISQTYPAVVIVGDFNDDRAACGMRLGTLFTAAIPTVERPTRPRTDPRSKSEVIDHVFVANCTATDVEVLAGGGLSDHHPVTATITR